MGEINGINPSKYIDLSYYGNTFSSNLNEANTIILKGSEAVKNSMKMYLMSQVGDYRRNVTKGGPMMKIIGKPLSPAYKTTIEDSIKKSLEVYNSVVVTSVVATPDVESKTWVVRVSFSDVYNKVQDSINLGIPGVS